MNISTTARHCEVDPEVRIHAQQRLEKLAHFVRNPDDLMEAHVVFDCEKYRHSAEVTLKIRRLGEVFSREEADDPRAAIELAATRLEHQLLKLKNKRLDRQREGGLRVLNGTAGTPSTDGEGEESFDDVPAEEGGADRRTAEE